MAGHRRGNCVGWAWEPARTHPSNEDVGAGLVSAHSPCAAGLGGTMERRKTIGNIFTKRHRMEKYQAPTRELRRAGVGARPYTLHMESQGRLYAATSQGAFPNDDTKSFASVGAAPPAGADARPAPTKRCRENYVGRARGTRPYTFTRQRRENSWNRIPRFLHRRGRCPRRGGHKARPYKTMSRELRRAGAGTRPYTFTRQRRENSWNRIPRFLHRRGRCPRRGGHKARPYTTMSRELRRAGAGTRP